MKVAIGAIPHARARCVTDPSSRTLRSGRLAAPPPIRHRIRGESRRRDAERPQRLADAGGMVDVSRETASGASGNTHSAQINAPIIRLSRARPCEGWSIPRFWSRRRLIKSSPADRCAIVPRCFVSRHSGGSQWTRSFCYFCVDCSSASPSSSTDNHTVTTNGGSHAFRGSCYLF